MKVPLQGPASQHEAGASLGAAGDERVDRDSFIMTLTPRGHVAAWGSATSTGAL